MHTASGGAVYVAPDPAPKEAAVFFFTRLGGASEPPYDSLNVSKKVGDDPKAVDENLAVIKSAMGLRPAAWVRQIAGDGVVRVSEPGFAGEADALVTSETDLCLSVAVADCVPVALVGEFGGEGVSGRQLSLPGPIRVDLERAGVGVNDLGLCSGCLPDLFYSHRKQGPLTGRNLASVVRGPR